MYLEQLTVKYVHKEFSTTTIIIGEVGDDDKIFILFYYLQYNTNYVFQ